MAGSDSVHWCWDCFFSSGCTGWKKYTKASSSFCIFSLFFNPIYNSSYSLSSHKFADSLVLWHVDTCFQPMLVLVTCEFHIPHIKIWISNFSQIAAGNDGSKDNYQILFFRFYHWYFLRNSNKLWKLLYFVFCGVL